MNRNDVEKRLMDHLTKRCIENSFKRPEGDKSQTVERLIKQLGDQRLSTRRKATNQLRGIGKEAMYQLKRHRDRENLAVTYRVDYLLQNIARTFVDQQTFRHISKQTRDESVKEARQVLRQFFQCLSEGKRKKILKTIHPETRERGAKHTQLDLIATTEPVGHTLLKVEIPDGGFEFESNIVRTYLRAPDEVVFRVHKNSSRGMGMDKAIVKREGSGWFIVNPVHLIR